MRVANYLATNIVGTAVVQVATGAGLLHCVTVNKTNTSPISILDGTPTATTATLATLKASIGEATYLYDCIFTTGLKLNVQSNSDVTVSWTTGMY